MPNHGSTTAGRWYAGWLAGLMWVAAAGATVECAPLLTDGMTLQQGQRVPLWGRAADGEQVLVQFQGQAVTVTAAGGQWQAWLEPLRATESDNLVVSGEHNTVIVRNVAVGDVWLCAGQSNMAYALSLADGAATAIAASGNRQVRLLSVPHSYSDTARTGLNARWHEAAPDTVPDFSAVGYFFGRDLFAARRTPIGLIDVSYGGTPIEAWMSPEALLASGVPEVLEAYSYGLTHYAAELKQTQRKLDLWRREVDSARAQGQPAPPPPEEDVKRLPAVLHNAMIAPLVPFGVKGVLWYQGESNAHRAGPYKALLRSLIDDWRARFKQADLPFLIVQLPGFDGSLAAEGTWAAIREAQLLTSLVVPHTTLVVTCDQPETDNLHPRQKEPVGRRLALAARGLAYGEPVVYCGPTYETMSVVGGRMRLHFGHTDGGLRARGGQLTGFALAGPDRAFHPAVASIEDDQVVVSSPHVWKAEAVRYGWSNRPLGNLFNGKGLPASPFRTDDWPLPAAANGR